LETIQKHDKNKIVKTVSIDTLRSMQKPIDPKIHSVPALLLLNTKEYIFGKAVFDYLLLPNRGILFASNSTRNEKRITRESDASTIAEVVTQNVPDEPIAFTLGSISAEHFSNIDDTDTAINDKNYNWDMIDNENNSKLLISPSPSVVASSSVSYTDDPQEKKKLPSMEEIMKQRSMDIQ
jgi:hypothetical protein